ncbi:MAG: cofactor-independent phosphoglycerate mutase [Candidatus Omnitrophica bacterium]|nr:cofactor-independent phosphoglycerate mutase [Candidatus Omnitrophota bacterium]
MKYIVVILDGAADYPLEMLGDRTPLAVADIPNIDSLVKGGQLGRVKTVPAGFSPSSDVANLSLLGYDPGQYYTGRGPLEAANLGIELGPDDLAFRCNFITEHDQTLFDYSAGHIRDHEAKILTDFLQQQLGNEQIQFYSGKSYRNLMVYRGGVSLGLDKLKYYPPHDILGKSIQKHMPRGENAERIIHIMNQSKQILSDHEINKVRVDLGENPAHMIWLWGCGRKPQMESFKSKFGVPGAVISAVDLIKGIGKIIGLEVLEVEGATGYYDTNYEGKARAALEALKTLDFVFIHIEAPDEAGHNQDVRMKITCLERIDKLIVGTLLGELQHQEFRILVTPDHPTPVELRTHTDEPVPFLIYGNGIDASGFSSYSELEAQNSPLYFEKGSDLLKYLLAK